VNSDVLSGVEKISRYCCVSKAKARELIDKKIIPCIIKEGATNRYATYTFVVDYVKNRILENKAFSFDENASKNTLMNQIFTKYPLERRDVFGDNNGVATVFANCNLKGGVGKTTTSITLASALSIMGARVLLIETDPQSNISIYMGEIVSGKCFSDVVLEFIKTDKIIDVKECISTFEFSNSKFDALLSDDRMLGKIEKINDNSFVRNVVYRLRNDYDFIIIDTPPSLQASLQQSYIASEFLNLITLPENLSVSGVRNLLSGIEELNEENINNGKMEDLCSIEHAVVTSFDGRMLNDQIENLLILEKTLSEYGVEPESIYKIKKSVVYPESTSRIKGGCPIYDMNEQYMKAVEDGDKYFELALKIYDRRISNVK